MQYAMGPHLLIYNLHPSTPLFKYNIFFNVVSHILEICKTNNKSQTNLLNFKNYLS